MQNTFSVGSTARRTLVVDRGRTIDFLGEDMRIYATPELIRDIEQLCLDFLQEHAEPGQSSVGTEVSVAHAGATPLGGDVTIDAEVVAIEGRSVTFRVTARDAQETVCTGTHRRFVVDVDRLKKRVQQKIGAAGAA